MKSARNPSITRRLLWFILVPVVLLVIGCASLAARMASQSVNNLYDQQMQTNAGVLLSFVLYESFEHQYEDEYEEDEAEEFLEIAEEINTQYGLPVNFRLTVDKQVLFKSNTVRQFPPCSDGFSNIALDIENNAEEWRCYSQAQLLVGGGRDLTVEIFESRAERKQAIRSLVLATFSPLILLPLLITALTVWALSWAVSTLRKVSEDVSERSVDNLQRLSLAEQPRELLPVATSVNHLLDGIERSLQREKQFTDDAAHELRTPVTSIKMIEQLLRRENKDVALNPYLDDLRASVNQSGELIEQLLGFARLQSARSLSFSEVNLEQVLHAELGILSPQLTGKNIAVSIEDDGYNEPVRANESAIALLVRNILSNACKFSPPAGTIYLYLDNNVLVIEDDGPGIPRHDRDRIFDRFYRTPDAKPKPGSGLGLALARWVADAHNYKLYARSPVSGSGACIVLDFGSETRQQMLDR